MRVLLVLTTQLSPVARPPAQAHTRFVFVPGPHDPAPASALPRPALAQFFAAEVLKVVPNAVFASNPCRCEVAGRRAPADEAQGAGAAGLGQVV